MYRVFESDRKEVSNRFKILSRKEAIEELYKPMLFNYNKYNNIYIFGDIHGCNEPLQNFFNEHPMQDDAAYIFTGDYLDRGIQNKEVMEFLLSIYNKDNVLLLEGNHERWLRIYAEGEAKQLTQEEKAMLKPYVDKSFWRKMDKSHIRNRGFKGKTAPQLSGLDKKITPVLPPAWPNGLYHIQRKELLHLPWRNTHASQHLRTGTSLY